jgi:glycine oxidase
LIGKLPASERQWIAGGHYRNGILLAPGTAVALADVLDNKPAAVDLHPFDPTRFR